MAVAIPPKISKYVDVAVSFGASLVIWGALRKITHAPDAETWLWIGLSTEALIFALYGVLYLIFPAEKGAGHPEEVAVDAVTPQGRVLGQMDKALLEADITPANLSRLSDGFKKLNTTISNMNDITDVVAATGDYTAKTKEVTSALTQVKDAYVNAANSVGAFNAASDGARVFHDQIQVLTKNLSSLNTIYELELQESNNHLKTLNGFYGKLAETTEVMVNSAEDAKKVQTQIGGLATNLTKLNGIYGNMLSAMQGR
ncbi:gliding motility protein GldL [Flavisolibacter ginsenosidimutans]|uniref:Gliding motility protein GldL n=1 Tax=Flavisolibacter ginsenosidimutans TaxID=661481 RepID=A0A5B8UMS7_9BACT|nr:gliding motility protein GldL [Flavisolibacter ginsenosidimutans]QEC57756.1 gliding motility protein GldL [Flavisolibacter ginsenosidimutans]